MEAGGGFLVGIDSFSQTESVDNVQNGSLGPKVGFSADLHQNFPRLTVYLNQLAANWRNVARTFFERARYCCQMTQSSQGLTQSFSEIAHDWRGVAGYWRRLTHSFFRLTHYFYRRAGYFFGLAADFWRLPGSREGLAGYFSGEGLSGGGVPGIWGTSPMRPGRGLTQCHSSPSPFDAESTSRSGTETTAARRRGRHRRSRASRRHPSDRADHTSREPARPPSTRGTLFPTVPCPHPYGAKSPCRSPWRASRGPPPCSAGRTQACLRPMCAFARWHRC